MNATIIIWLVLYFIPTLIAAIRQHHNGIPVFLVNLFLGWTVVGWVVAMVWSCTAIKPELQPSPKTSKHPACPYCFGAVDARAQKCPHCAEWIAQSEGEKSPPQVRKKSQLKSLFQGKDKHFKYLGQDDD